MRAFHELLLLPALLRTSFSAASASASASASTSASPSPSDPEVHDDDNGLFSFRSRPDIRAPKWEIEVYDQARLAPGYWFFGPYETLNMDDELGNGWIGPHIYAQDGSLVWSGATLFENGNIEDFRLSSVDGEEMMTLMDQRHAKGVFLDKSFKVRERKEAGGPEKGGFNSHEFHFVENGTKALVVWTKGKEYSPAETEESLGFGERCHVACDGIHEYDVRTWESSWQWTSCDHIGLEESSYKTGFLDKQCSGRWDYVHANSVDKTEEGDYILSARHTNTIYKISKDNGTILWRLSGTGNSDFEHTDGLNFSRQHDIRYRGHNATHTFLSFLDNAKGLDSNDPTFPYSRGLLVALDERWMKAEVAAHYDHPDGEGGLAFRRGNFQPLANGNVFMCWSERALQSEHAADGKMLMQARLRVDWLGTYRGYKFEFEGTPGEPPDAVGEVVRGRHGTRTEVYVSWNGATEVKAYKLYKTKKGGKLRLHVDTQQKNGFETKLSYDGVAEYVIVHALHANGTVLGQSDIVKIAALKTPEVDDEEPDTDTDTDTDDNTHDDTDPEPSDPYWYSDIGFFLISGLFLAGFIGVVFIIWRRLRHGGASGPRRSLLDILRRGRYQPLRDDGRELDEREGKEGLMNGHRRRRDSDDDAFADQFSLGDEDSDAEEGGKGRSLEVDGEGGEEFRRR